jgi:hypothetical protein
MGFRKQIKFSRIFIKLTCIDLIKYNYIYTKYSNYFSLRKILSIEYHNIINYLEIWSRVSSNFNYKLSLLFRKIIVANSFISTSNITPENFNWLKISSKTKDLYKKIIVRVYH